MISHARIDDDNLRMVVRQQKFRRAADVVTVSWSQFAEVVAIALIGSVARPLWKEVPRFWPYQQRRIELWHECKDVDLAIWLDDLSRLGEIRRARSLAIKTETARDPNFGVADYHVDTFIFEPGSDRYVGRLCQFNCCPKHRPECNVTGCGAIPFNRIHPNFVLCQSILTNAADTTLYTRSKGILMSANDLPCSGSV